MTPLSNTISITEARRRLFDVAEAVQTPGSSYMLTERGRPKAVIMSAGEYSSWAETLEVIKDFPDLDHDIAQAQEDYQKGRYITLDELLLKDGQFAVHKGSKYHVSSRNTSKISKRSSKN